MGRFSVVLDACVLVPISLADTLLRLAEADLFRPLWSQRILDEMLQALENIYPAVDREDLNRRAHTMNDAFEDAMVCDWEPLLPGIQLPDENDRHVVAAAQRGRADLIVTNNIKDFPHEILRKYALEAQSPDEFLLNQLDLAPKQVVQVLCEQAAATKQPQLGFDTILSHLSRTGATRFAQEAAQQKWRLDGRRDSPPHSH